MEEDDDCSFASSSSDEELSDETRTAPPDTVNDFYYADEGPWLSEDFLIELHKSDPQEKFSPHLKDWKVYTQPTPHHRSLLVRLTG